MPDAAREILEASFEALGRRDVEASLALFADDALLIDPHYPNPHMTGHAAIRQGLEWVMTVMDQLGFRIVSYFGSEDGLSAAVEVETNHVLKGGRKLSFPQAFFIETRNGRIMRLQAYEPYGPNGIGGFFLGLERLKRKLFG